MFDKKNIEIRDKKFYELNNKQIFTYIYQNRLWNPNDITDFNSGPGSHDSKVINPYINCIINFFKNQHGVSSVLDLGCGDFYIGNKLYKYVENYIGIDVVDELINRNKELYLSKNLNFSCLDIVKDNLPDGDCVLLREVLQHLINEEIIIILNKLYKYKYVIITENIPFGKFHENIDKIKGPESREYLDSGIIVDKPPFNFKFHIKKELLKIKRPGIGYIVTSLYETNKVN
tara:strand:+ start:1518 stop:2210 length:693 start_codon:yes stop_codon:yes gene_type:complete